MVAGTLNREKYLNALLYFVTECGNDHLGIMKLNKLFYYLDFVSYRDRGVSVTGETYVHLPKGPFAQALDEDVLPAAQKEKRLERKQEESEKYGVRNRFQALQPYDLSVFDPYEQKLLHDICVNFKDWSTDQMVAQTHTEAPWVFSQPGEPLDFSEADDIELFSNESTTA